MSTFVNHPQAPHECPYCGSDALTFSGNYRDFPAFTCDACTVEHVCGEACQYLKGDADD